MFSNYFITICDGEICSFLEKTCKTILLSGAIFLFLIRRIPSNDKYKLRVFFIPLIILIGSFSIIELNTKSRNLDYIESICAIFMVTMTIWLVIELLMVKFQKPNLVRAEE